MWIVSTCILAIAVVALLIHNHKMNVSRLTANRLLLQHLAEIEADAAADLAECAAQARMFLPITA